MSSYDGYIPCIYHDYKLSRVSRCGSSFVLFIDDQQQDPAVRAMQPMAPQQWQPDRTLQLVIHDGWHGVFRNRHRLGSALVEHINLQPSLETFSELFTSAGKVVFCSKGNTLGRPLVLRDVGLVHDELALPDTSKGQVPEIAVDDVLKACAN